MPLPDEPRARILLPEMPLPEAPLPEIYVLPGESHLVTSPTVLRTVLGSCVGIAFLSPRLGVGALCHPMLPKCPATPPADASVATGRRYVDFAIRDLVKQFAALGALPAEIRVKLFGGGDVLRKSGSSTRPTVGRMNSETALRVLEEHGFEVAAHRLRGNSGVHIRFNTGTGEVLLKRLRQSSAGDALTG